MSTRVFDALWRNAGVPYATSSRISLRSIRATEKIAQSIATLARSTMSFGAEQRDQTAATPRPTWIDLRLGAFGVEERRILDQAIETRRAAPSSAGIRVAQ